MKSLMLDVEMGKVTIRPSYTDKVYRFEYDDDVGVIECLEKLFRSGYASSLAMLPSTPYWSDDAGLDAGIVKLKTFFGRCVATAATNSVALRDNTV